MILWDGAPIHRSRLVKNYVASTRRRLVLERLPRLRARTQSGRIYVGPSQNS